MRAVLAPVDANAREERGGEQEPDESSVEALRAIMSMMCEPSPRKGEKKIDVVVVRDRMKSTKPVVTVTANRFVNKKQADRHGGRTAVFTLARHICSRESFEAVDGCQRKFRYCIRCTAVQGLPKRCLGQAFHTVNMSESDAKPSE